MFVCLCAPLCLTEINFQTGGSYHFVTLIIRFKSLKGLNSLLGLLGLHGIATTKRCCNWSGRCTTLKVLRAI